MTSNKLYRLMDLVEDIKKLDEIIQIHSQSSEESLMRSQYEAKKIERVSLLIQELNTVPSKTSYFKLQIIAKLLNKFIVQNVTFTRLSDDNDAVALQSLVDAI